MSLLRNFFTSRRLQSKLRNLPPLQLQTEVSFFRAMTLPAPDLSVRVWRSDGRLVGRVSYAVSPLLDRLYIYDIRIEPPFLRRGYALAVLAELAARHGVPITPVKELAFARGFWNDMRLVPALRVTAGLSIDAMLKEPDRWQHLSCEAKAIMRAVDERLLAGEPWAQATGRSVD